MTWERFTDGHPDRDGNNDEPNGEADKREPCLPLGKPCRLLHENRYRDDYSGGEEEGEGGRQSPDARRSADFGKFSADDLELSYCPSSVVESSVTLTYPIVVRVTGGEAR